jgi:hypothetical protein
VTTKVVFIPISVGGRGVGFLVVICFISQGKEAYFIKVKKFGK